MSDTSRLTLSDSRPIPGTTVMAQAFWVILFGAATAVGARLEIPHEPVPYTLQTLVVLLAGAFLGTRNGAISQLAYLAAGLLGAPVFARGAFGPVALVGPTGGYLLSFPLAAAIVGLLISRHTSLSWSLVSMAAGLVVIFSMGTIHLYAFTMHDFPSAFSSGFLIFSWWDMVKLGAAAMTYREFAKRWGRVPSQD